ncbi:MAG: sialidase family protein [Kiritimatiellia bacterium]
MLHKQDLFEARTHGYKTFRIPGIAVTKNNVVLATCEARPGGGGDYDFNDILIRRSTDGGETFDPFVKQVDHTTYGPGPVSNFVMIPDWKTGRVHVVFCHDYERVFHMFSDDDGATFSDPVEITTTFELFREEYSWRVCATGPGHGLQLRDGRLLVPVWLSDSSANDFGPGHRGHRPSIVASVYSDDNGTTWRRGGIVCGNGDTVEGSTVVNPSETVAVELENGSVLFNMRSESMNNRRLVAVSPDGATDWQIRGFDPVVNEPVCMGSLIRHSWSGEGAPGQIVFANPDTLDKEMRRVIDPELKRQSHCDRKNLTVRVSEDECQSWVLSRVIEPGPAGYSDLAVLQDGTILCLYECDIVERIHDDRYLRLARFNPDWVAAG